MTDAFAGRRREAFQDQRMPDWTARAYCATKTPVAGEPLEDAFKDDITYRPERCPACGSTNSETCTSKWHEMTVNGEYIWPAGTLEAMKLCAACPVKVECLTYAHDYESLRFKLGVRGTTDEEYEATGESFVHDYIVPMPSGVYGGLPGPQRERFQHRPDWLEASQGWFMTLSIARRWVTQATAEEGVA